VEKPSKETLEAAIRERCAAGDYRRAIEAALAGYGHEFLGYLVNEARGEESVDDLLGEFRKNVLTGIPQFRWESTFRTWAFRILRNTVARHRRDLALRSPPPPPAPSDSSPRVMPRLEEPLSISKIPHEITSIPGRVQKREEERLLREMLDKLTEDERRLLFSHVERELTFEQIAEEMSAQGAGKVTAAALRKRYERIQKKLREMAEAEGLR
jgi:RNA polymerase sigma-70 factor (ECF subfamily)